MMWAMCELVISGEVVWIEAAQRESMNSLWRSVEVVNDMRYV